jgi:hypothetical protein
MRHAPETYIADAELAVLLTSAHETGVRVRVKAGEKTYELEVKSASEWLNPYAGCTEEEIAASLHARAGIFTAEEAERIIELIYKAREQGTRPIDRR